MELRETIRIMRKELCMTQTELAAVLHLNYSTISRWENGRGFPNSSTAAYVMHYAKEKHISAECLKCLQEALYGVHRKSLSVPESDLYTVERESICRLVDDSTNAIYVVDTETDNLLYVNHKCEELAGTAFEDGSKCYQYLMGRNTPCSFCSKHRINECGTVERRIVHPKSGHECFVAGRSIEWNGRKAHVRYLTDLSHVITTEDNAKWERQVNGHE